MNLRLSVAVMLLAFVHVTPAVVAAPPEALDELAETPEPPSPPLTPLRAPAAQCVAARAVFGEEWHIASNPSSAVANICGATSCVAVDLVTGEVGLSSFTVAPVIDDEPPSPIAALAEAFGVTCPATATSSYDYDKEPVPCPALTRVLKFPSERAGRFARGAGPKARWLVSEIFGDDESMLDLTARTHIYDAATRRHLGSVTQKHVNADPDPHWVTDSCALVWEPFPSSQPHPARLLCAGRNRLVSTIAQDDPTYPGPRAANALSDTRLAMWHVDESMSVVRIVALPNGRELSSFDVPFLQWSSQVVAVPASVFATRLRVLVFADNDRDTLHVIDPIAKKVLRAWKWNDCQ